jgi:hypothetical protein
VLALLQHQFKFQQVHIILAGLEQNINVLFEITPCAFCAIIHYFRHVRHLPNLIAEEDVVYISEGKGLIVIIFFSNSARP